MPINAWICQPCGGRSVPLNHFATTQCGDKIHPDYTNAILQDSLKDRGKGIRVTMGLGCPRATAIRETEQYAVDPLSMNAMVTGTAWHAFMERNALANAEVELSGTIEGLAIGGKTDRLRGKSIDDWKHMNDFRRKYVAKDTPKNYATQLSIYAELAAQSGYPRPEYGTIWAHFSSSGKDALLPIRVELIPIKDAIAYKPQDGEFTVLALYLQAHEYFTGAKKWHELPMAGETMMFGDKNLCLYCEVKAVCWTQAKGAPF